METEMKKRKHAFRHQDYILSVADKVHKIIPTKQILINTFVDVYKTAFTEGYLTRLSDSVWFRDKQNERREASWNSIRDHLEEIIHTPKK